MDLNFRYNCSCQERKKLTFNKLLDDDYQRRLQEYMNDIVDRAWDEQDTEILSLMIAIINTLRNSSDVNEDSLTDTNSMAIRDEMDLAILKMTSIRSSNSCNCNAISRQISIVLDAGLAELSVKPVREESLLEKVMLVKPFVSLLEGDTICENFFIRCWKQAIQFFYPKLIEQLTLVYPQFLESLLNALIEQNQPDCDTLTQSKEFKYLSRCLTVGPSFYTVLSYIARKNMDGVQHVISSCIAYAKAELPSKIFYTLFPVALRPYAIIMNEMISPNDPNVLILIEELKANHPIDYKILLMSCPIFYSSFCNK